jgi:hypothetical protein
MGAALHHRRQAPGDGHGQLPRRGLAEARDKASECRKLAKDGVDPIEARQTEPEKTPTFTTCAARYIRAHRRGWKNTKHARQWVNTLKTYARLEIGPKKVDAIPTEDILKILSPIWTSKTETAKRVQGRIECILDYAAAHKYRDPLNPAAGAATWTSCYPSPQELRRSAITPPCPTPKFLPSWRNCWPTAASRHWRCGF